MNDHRQTGGAPGGVGGGWSKSRSRCAEGATGGFFDTDVVLANPTGAIVPISVDFLPEGGAPIGITRAVNAVPLAAERTMIWDSTGYGGHGGSRRCPRGIGCSRKDRRLFQHVHPARQRQHHRCVRHAELPPRRRGRRHADEDGAS